MAEELTPSGRFIWWRPDPDSSPEQLMPVADLPYVKAQALLEAARAIGQELEPWQAGVLERWLRRRAERITENVSGPGA